MKALLKNYRQAPRKVRLVADAIRGKGVSDALMELSFMPKKAAIAMHKLLSSAAANAKQKGGTKAESLIVKEITVDKGMTFKRYRARARGRASPINKETSHISLTLGEK